MEIKKIIRKNNQGGIEATWYISEDQTKILLGYAIQSLIAAGLAFVTEMPEEEFKRLQEEANNDALTEFLESVDKDSLPEA